MTHNSTTGMNQMNDPHMLKLKADSASGFREDLKERNIIDIGVLDEAVSALYHHPHLQERLLRLGKILGKPDV